jgi:aminopeptidase N
MDWFFDEWLYRMGHPVFQVAKTYDPSTKKLTLTVKQAQKPDPDWQYPQVGYFQTPVDIELVTNGQARVERVNIEARAEQSFAFSADSEPQIVNFDYGSTIIKEIEFNKPTTELLYQASMDQDVAGRLWALRQLSERLKDPGTANAEQSQINEQISSVLVKDNFWGVRLEAATVLTPTNDISRQALIAAVKDTSAKVRARAIASLSSAKNPALIPIYLQSINDRSYAVIRAAALALGQTKSAEAFPALTKLIEEKSWRDSIKVSALNGLSALGDSRGLEIALRLSEKGNAPVLRAAALKMVGAVTRDDPRAFPILSKSLTEAAEKGDFTISTAAAEGLANLGDPRGLGVFEEILKNPNGSFQLRTVLIQLQERLRRTAAASSTAPQHP